jgi:3-methyladenine DNA glycosylase AlkD
LTLPDNHEQLTVARQSAVLAALQDLANPKDAIFLQRFFKTAPGQYGAGDHFLGIRVPALRALARVHADLPLGSTIDLLRSRHHEARLLALLILVNACKKADDAQRTAIYQAYLANTRYINNWDLVDASAPDIVGRQLENGSRAELPRLARSSSLWERRIAIVATFHFIRHNDFADTLRIARLLLKDEHDLIHKAVGWMLREVGKRDQAAEEKFLERHYKQMPRTMLRYAIERFPEKRRLQYLHGAPLSPP